MFRPFVLSQTRNAKKAGQRNGAQMLRWRPRLFNERFLGLLTEMLLYNEIGMRAPYESIKSFFHSLHLNSLLYQSR